MDALPSAAQLEAVLADEDGAAGKEPWVRWATTYGIAVSVEPGDKLFTPPSNLGQGRNRLRGRKDPILVSYRPAQDELVTTWKIERVDDPTGTLADRNQIGPYRATITGADRYRVVRRREEVTLALDVGMWKSGALSVAFNKVGEPAEVGGESTPLAAEALTELGGTVKEAVETGSALGVALTPGSATAKYLERELEARLQLARLGAIGGRTPALVYHLGGG